MSPKRRRIPLTEFVRKRRFVRTALPEREQRLHHELNLPSGQALLVAMDLRRVGKKVTRADIERKIGFISNKAWNAVLEQDKEWQSREYQLRIDRLRDLGVDHRILSSGYLLRNTERRIEKLETLARLARITGRRVTVDMLVSRPESIQDFLLNAVFRRYGLNKVQQKELIWSFGENGLVTHLIGRRKSDVGNFLAKELLRIEKKMAREIDRRR